MTTHRRGLPEWRCLPFRGEHPEAFEQMRNDDTRYLLHLSDLDPKWPRLEHSNPMGSR